MRRAVQIDVFTFYLSIYCEAQFCLATKKVHVGTTWHNNVNTLFCIYIITPCSALKNVTL